MPKRNHQKIREEKTTHATNEKRRRGSLSPQKLQEEQIKKTANKAKWRASLSSQKLQEERIKTVLNCPVVGTKLLSM